jgi:DNA repair protein RAD5
MNKCTQLSDRKTERLKALVQCLLLRREKTHINRTTGQVLVKLPEKVIEEHMLDFTDLERRLYDRLYNQIRYVMCRTAGPIPH